MEDWASESLATQNLCNRAAQWGADQIALRRSNASCRPGPARAAAGGVSVTNKQLYILCGVITVSTAYITNSTFLGVFALLWFVSSIVSKND